MKRTKSLEKPPINIEYEDFIRDPKGILLSKGANQRVLVKDKKGEIVASFGGSLGAWNNDLPDGPFEDPMCDIAAKNLMKAGGWDLASIVLGYALAQGLSWEDYGETWAIEDHMIVERI